MVHEQGDMVDSIESNIEAASVQVHQGTDQLRQVRLCSFYASVIHSGPDPHSQGSVSMTQWSRGFGFKNMELSAPN